MVVVAGVVVGDIRAGLGGWSSSLREEMKDSHAAFITTFPPQLGASSGSRIVPRNIQSPAPSSAAFPSNTPTVSCWQETVPVEG